MHTAFIRLCRVLAVLENLSLRCMDSLVVACGLSCSMTCGMLVSQPEIELRPLCRKGDS